ncbi:MAG: PilZ domain-containing protein [Acidobacteria bacterium]|nr:PilZ domain-containing protein [Acidobacteriota bacterium]MBS1865589.1 PilZ domain-containing protein [Acidobacteriota bacterium]
MPDVMADRRNSPRFALILLATITETASQTKIATRTSDVSKTGCYVDTLNPLPKGTKVRVELTRGEELFETVGTVMYVSPGLGMGLQFQEPVAEEQMNILTRWLENSAHLRL